MGEQKNNKIAAALTGDAVKTLQSRVNKVIFMANLKQTTEYRELSLEELKEREYAARLLIFRLDSEGSIPGNVKPHERIAARRNLARILTVMTEKQQEVVEGRI